MAAALAGIMPDTFLDSPYTTIPHEAAFLIRGWVIFGAFGYIALVAAVRVAIYLSRRIITGRRRGFPVVVNAPGKVRNSQMLQ